MWDFFFFFLSLTGRVYLYANEGPVTFKAGCLNSGKGRETRVLFVWMQEKEKCSGSKIIQICSLGNLNIYIVGANIKVLFLFW